LATLKVVGIEKAMSSATVCYWHRKEDVGKVEALSSGLALKKPIIAIN